MKNIILVLIFKIGNLFGMDYGKFMDFNKILVYCMRKIIVLWY